MNDLNLDKFSGSLSLSDTDLEFVSGGADTNAERKYKIGDTVYAVLSSTGEVLTFEVVDYASKVGGIFSYVCKSKNTGELVTLQETALDFGAAQAGKTKGFGNRVS